MPRILIVGISLAALIIIAYLVKNLAPTSAYILSDSTTPPPLSNQPPQEIDFRIATQTATPYAACATKFAIAKAALQLPSNQTTADKLSRWENSYSKALVAWSKVRYNTSLAPQDSDFSSRAYATYIRWVGAVMDLGLRWRLFIFQFNQMQDVNRIPEVKAYYDCVKLSSSAQSSSENPTNNSVNDSTVPDQTPPPASNNNYIAPTVVSSSPYVFYLNYDSRYPGYTVFYKISSTAPFSRCKAEFASGLKLFNSAELQKLYRAAVAALSPAGQPFTWDNLSTEARTAHAAFSAYLSTHGDPFAPYNNCVHQNLPAATVTK